MLRISQEQPLLVLFEDAQWANPSALDLLASLVRAVALARASGEPARVAFAMTYRPVPAPHPLLGLLDTVRELNVGLQLQLLPLDEPGSKALVGSMLMSEVEGPLER